MLLRIFSFTCVLSWNCRGASEAGPCSTPGHGYRHCRVWVSNLPKSLNPISAHKHDKVVLLCASLVVQSCLAHHSHMVILRFQCFSRQEVCKQTP